MTKEKNTQAEAYNADRPYTPDLWRRIQTIIGTTVDGVPGPQTATKIEQYQRDNELSADGMCGPVTLAHMGEGPFVFQDNAILVPIGKAAVNADGAPNAYSAADNGIDFLANAGRPGRWWGIATQDNGEPFIQQPHDPSPNFFVSTTALIDIRYPEGDPRRYLDSRREPFVALPGNLRDIIPSRYDIQLGCTVFVAYDDSTALSVFGDIGPRVWLEPDRYVNNQRGDRKRLFGECSIAVHEQLKHDPYSLRDGLWRANIGISKGVSYKIIPRLDFAQQRTTDTTVVERKMHRH